MERFQPFEGGLAVGAVVRIEFDSALLPFGSLNVTFAQPEAKSLNYSKNDDWQAVAKSMGIQWYPPSE
jgi:hypothetical protein